LCGLDRSLRRWLNAEGVRKMNEQELAASVRAALLGGGTVREVKMFGGIGFMLNGNLIAGASKRGLLLRVGKDRLREALALPGARPMEMKGRTIEGYIYVDHPALDDRAVQACIRLALPHVLSLPPKAPPAKREATKVKKK
jgi:TfoX/Sxy family transcriptional regulator of competence genes